MAYNIVKHRRGTTAEWALYDLVPESGELVIEECLDGVRRCKIGDGCTEFSKLPYTDETVRQELLSYVDTVANNITDDFDSKLSELSASLDKNTNTAITKLEAFVQSKINTLDTNTDSNFNSLVTMHKESEAKLTETVHAIEKELDDILKYISTYNVSYASNLSNIKNNIKTIEDNISSLEKAKLDNAYSIDELKNTINTYKNSLKALNSTFNSKLTEIDDTLSAVDNKLQRAISELKAADLASNKEYTIKLSELSAKLKQLSDANIVLTAKLADINAFVNSTTDKLTHDIDSLTKNQTDNAVKLDLYIDGVYSFIQTSNISTVNLLLEYTSNIYEELELMKQEDTELLQLINNLSISLLAKLATSKKELDNKINEVDALANKAITSSKVYLLGRLDEDIKKLSDIINNNHSYIISLVNTLHAELQTDVNKNAELISNTSKGLDDLNNKLDTEVANIKTTASSNFKASNKQIENLKNELASQSEKTLEKHNLLNADLNNFKLTTTTELSSNKAALEALNDDLAKLSTRLEDSIVETDINVSVKYNNLNSAVHRLETDVEKHITDSNASIVNLTEELANYKAKTDLELTTKIKKDINLLQVAVDDTNKLLLGRFSSVEKTITSNNVAIRNVLSDLQRTSLDLQAHIDNVDAKVEQQTRRISNIINLKDGSTTGDLELKDIRIGHDKIEYASAGDAVRAVGQKVDDLIDSLPDYIPANAVDGLHYENNMLYLTTKGVVLEDTGVEVKGGNGGGGSTSTVRVKNELTTSSFAVSSDSEAIIKFTYTSLENDIPTGDGVLTIVINNKKIDELCGKVQHGLAKELDVASYLKNGDNTIKVTCTDQYGVSRSLIYNISRIDLSITSTFDSTELFKDTITFRYKIFGAIEKTAHVFVDDIKISEVTFKASVTNTETTVLIPKQTHGSHTIKTYLTATFGDKNLKSNILEYEILCEDAASNDAAKAMIASVFTKNTIEQGSLVSIPYQVYDPSNAEPEVILSIYEKIAGAYIELEESRLTTRPGRLQAYWNTRSYPVGTVKFRIEYTYSYYGEPMTIYREHELIVTPITVDVSAESDQLQLFLTAQGRVNNDINKNIWKFNSANPQEPEVTTTFTNFNWSSNGWCLDNDGNTCLRLNGDARATINFKPFATDFKSNGKTIEIEFAVRDINDRTAVLLSCLDGAQGMQITPDMAFMQSSGSYISCRFKEDERIRVSFTVEHDKSGSQFVSIYLDGVLSGVKRYKADTDVFKQTNPVDISLGSSNCGIDIYTIRIYNKALTTQQILNNYIADKDDNTVKKTLLAENDVLDPETDALSYERLSALGHVPIITFTGKMPTYKDDKKKNSVRMKFEDPAHADLNFDVLLSEIDVQGTSSAGYVRKNWKVKLPEERQHMPGAIPAKVFCIKVDYAEATGTHNTGTANYVETFYDRSIVTLPPQLDDSRVRTTIQGFPCVIFEKADENSEPVFSSKGNFNYDKGAEAVFGFIEKYDAYGAECWEFCNNISDAVSFLGPVPDDWKDDFEPRYVPESYNFEKIEDLLKKRENAEKGEGIFTEAQQTALSTFQTECIKNFKEMHDWVVSTALYKVVEGNRIPIVPKKDDDADLLSEEEKAKYILPQEVTYENTVYRYDTEEYRLAKFKNEFSQYFNTYYATMYYVFTSFALMVDQRAKNMFLTRWKDSDGVYRWYPYFYDNDTIFGINNVGALVFDYYHEDIDQVEAANVYNGQNSVLWNNFRLCFSSEIKALYASLRSDDKLTYDEIVKYYITEGSDKWSAAIYNADAEYKYICMARPDEKGNIDENNLKQVRGPAEHHLRYFVSNRLDYCDSKWYAGNYPNDQIVLRVYTPSEQTDFADKSQAEQDAIAISNERIRKSNIAVPPSPSLTITPYSSMYAGVRYASGTLQQKRLSAGESHTFNAPEGVNTNDAETSIYGASGLASLGDLSALYCDYIDISKATKLTTLKLGNEHADYRNDNIKSVTLGQNRLLKTLDIRNCSGLGVAGGSEKQLTLSVENCTNIENIYAEGTSLQAISLPDGGYVKVLHLPETVNSIVLKNQRHINDFSIANNNYSNIRTLHIENCSSTDPDIPNAIDTKEMLENCWQSDVDEYGVDHGHFTVEHVHLVDFDWGTVSKAFLQRLIPVRDGDRLVSGVLGLGDEDRAYLKGTCYVEEPLTGAEYAELKYWFKDLTINFRTVMSKVYFKYKNNQNEEYITVEVPVPNMNSEFESCTPPKDIIPQWPDNAAFTYEHIGWSVMEQVSKGINDSEDDYKEFLDAINGSSLTNIVGDRTLYPVFKANRLSYTISFKNPSDEDKELYSYSAPYGSTPEYPYSLLDIKKADSATPDMYTCTGWYPNIETVTGIATYYAQFKILDDKWNILDVSDISNCTDINGNTYNGYTLDTKNSTIAITRSRNVAEKAFKVLEQIEIDGSSYFVNYLSCFADHTNLELVSLPDTLPVIGARAFYNCYRLFEITLPNSLTTIGANAFQGCSRLSTINIPKNVTSIGDASFADCQNLVDIEVDAENESFYVETGCLMSKNTKKLIQACNTENTIIPSDTASFGQYCFSNTNIKNAIIPNTVTEIASNAFSRCRKLTNIVLPNTLKVLDATCFAWCSSLSEINLPESLTTIKTYVFDSCALSDVVIPAATSTILERAFGDMPSLKKITFNANTLNGKVIVPNIHYNAFINSGVEDTQNPLVFELPWSFEQHKAAFNGMHSEGYGEDLYWVQNDPWFGAAIGSKLVFINDLDVEGNPRCCIKQRGASDFV